MLVFTGGPRHSCGVGAHDQATKSIHQTRPYACPGGCVSAHAGGGGRRAARGGGAVRGEGEGRRGVRGEGGGRRAVRGEGGVDGASAEEAGVDGPPTEDVRVVSSDMSSFRHARTPDDATAGDVRVVSSDMSGFRHARTPRRRRRGGVAHRPGRRGRTCLAPSRDRAHADRVVRRRGQVRRWGHDAGRAGAHLGRRDRAGARTGGPGLHPQRVRAPCCHPRSFRTPAASARRSSARPSAMSRTAWSRSVSPATDACCTAWWGRPCMAYRTRGPMIATRWASASSRRSTWPAFARSSTGRSAPSPKVYRAVRGIPISRSAVCGLRSAVCGSTVAYAMHALRIAHQGSELLSTGRITLPIAEPVRSRLMEVRRGDIPLRGRR